MKDLPKPIDNSLRLYSKLHYYKYFYSECLKTFADMSWWTFYKVSRIIRNELPKYDPDSGKRLEWKVTRIYGSQKYDINTGKPTNPKQLIRIDVDGYLFSLSKIKTRVFEYDIERGKLYIMGVMNSKYPYAELHPTDKGFKVL